MYVPVLSYSKSVVVHTYSAETSVVGLTSRIVYDASGTPCVLCR